MRTVALDWGQRISFCEVEGGKVTHRATAESLDALVGLLGPETPPAKVAIEACREVWHVAKRLREWGHVPILVDTTRVRQLGIGQHKRKNDRIDAETLARALAENRLPKAHELSEHRQRLRRAVNGRALLIEMRSKAIIAIRGEARTMGQALGSCNADDFSENLKQLSAEIKAQVEPLCLVLTTVESALLAADEQLTKVSMEEPATSLLQSVPGVGPIVSASFVSVIDDPKRFETAHQVEAYIGLVPSENTSGKRRLGSITKQGNSYLRAVLVQAAWTIMRSRKSSTLKSWGKQVKARRGKSVAVVALARRLAGVLWAMWRDNKPFAARHLCPAYALEERDGPAERTDTVGMTAPSILSQQGTIS
jgi:transposase